MPIYEFRCVNCGKMKEELLEASHVSTFDAYCNCNMDGNLWRMERVFSAPTIQGFKEMVNDVINPHREGKTIQGKEYHSEEKPKIRKRRKKI